MLLACLLAIGASTSVKAVDPNWPKALTLGTASPGGVYYIYGDVLAKILTEKLGIAVNPLPTQGPVHNVKLVEGGGAQLGLITMGVGLQGWNGTGDWTKGQKFRNMRALFPMYDTPFQAVVLRRSGITTFAQLDKKRIGVGPRAGTGGTYIPEILKVLGMSAELNFGSFDFMATEFIAGRYDAFVTLIGAPVPTFRRRRRTSRSLSSVCLPKRLLASVRRCRSSALQKSRPERTALRIRTTLPSGSTILQSDGPISPTIWSINWSRQYSKINLAF